MQTYSVLVLKADRFHADLLSRAVRALFADARCETVHGVSDARQYLKNGTVDLFIAGTGSEEGDALELLAHFVLKENRAGATVAIVNRHERRTWTLLRGLSINGVLDSSNEGVPQFEVAIQTVRAGQAYWSKTLFAPAQGSAMDAVARRLTSTEQLVFAAIGDGSDDRTAARLLSLKPSTIHSFRRAIHRKLGLKHKGELIRAAALAGYVQFTPSGTVRPGFSLMLSMRRPRRTLGMCRLPDTSGTIGDNPTA